MNKFVIFFAVILTGYFLGVFYPSLGKIAISRVTTAVGS